MILSLLENGSGPEIPKCSRDFKIEFEICAKGSRLEGFLIRANGDPQSQQFCTTFAASLVGDLPSVILVPEDGIVLVNHQFQATEQSEIAPASCSLKITRRQFKQLLEIRERTGNVLITPMIHPDVSPVCKVHFD